ncbi:MAG: roadblock/LC7 domain-containing protein [Gammaproteobacteria bacterium]
MEPTIGNRGADPRYQPLLDELTAATPGLRGVIISTADGLVISHRLPDGIDPLNFAAMVATLGGVAESTCEELALGRSRRSQLEGDAGQLLVAPLSNELVAGLLIEPGTTPETAHDQLQAHRDRLLAVA